MIGYSSLVGSVADTTILSGFNTSLRNDLQAAANIADRIDQTSLATFMNIIEECEGQLLTSGIGITYGSCIDRSHFIPTRSDDLVCALNLITLTLCAGKSGLVAQRFAGTLSSLGILANFVNAAEWIHGDLGNVSTNHPSTALHQSSCYGIENRKVDEPGYCGIYHSLFTVHYPSS